MSEWIFNNGAWHRYVGDLYLQVSTQNWKDGKTIASIKIIGQPRDLINRQVLNFEAGTVFCDHFAASYAKGILNDLGRQVNCPPKSFEQADIEADANG